MRLFAALCALFWSLPASAATFVYDFNAVWLDGNGYWEAHGSATKAYYQTERYGRITVDAETRRVEDCYIGDRGLCSFIPRNTVITEDSISGNLYGGGGDARIFDLSPDGGIFRYICDCTWQIDPENNPQAISFTGTYRLQLTAVPVPSAMALFLGGLAALGLLAGRRRAA